MTWQRRRNTHILASPIPLRGLRREGRSGYIIISSAWRRSMSSHTACLNPSVGKPMRFIFCADYWNIRRPDPAYEAEVEAARNLGYACSLIDFEALIEGRNSARALRTVAPASARELAIYRGWMLKPQQYELLYQALEAKGVELINSPAAYKHCHYLPEWYPLLAEHTPA